MTNIESVIREARRLGQVKAEEMQNKIRNGEMSWFPCGGAWISGVKGNTKFGKVFKRLAEPRGGGYYLGGPDTPAYTGTSPVPRDRTCTSLKRLAKCSANTSTRSST